MTTKIWVRACAGFVLFATSLAVVQPGVASAWTVTSPQVSVSVFRGVSDSLGYSLVVDLSGNIYTTGYFSGTADFDPGVGTANLTAAGGMDAFVSKLDASGNYVWAKGFGGTDAVQGIALAVDSAGNTYTTGYLFGTADFDPGAGTANLTSAGDADVFVSKLDASGNYVWAKSFGGTRADGGQSVAVDFSDNVYTTGTFQESVDFDPGTGNSNLTSAGSTDAFVSKLDASGNYVWAKSFGGTSAEGVTELKVDSSGNIYTTGSFEGTADFDPGAGTANLASAGDADVFISKLDALGSYVWVKSFGGSDREGANGLAVDSSGNIYTTGSFTGTVDFDPDAGTANITSVGYQKTNVFVSKLDASGSYVWAKSFGGNDNNNGLSVAVDSSGNIYTTGGFSSTADFDPGTGTANLTSAGSSDVFVSKLDASGNYVWAKSFGSVGVTSQDVGYSVAVDSSGNIYTTGWFQGTVDFDTSVGTTNLTSAGGRDVFVLKMDASNGSSSLAPGAPTSVSATSAANAQSVVSWTAPASTGGATITGYTVTSSPDGRTCGWTTGALSCTVTGLTNGTSYTFSVTATSVNGTGNSSDSSSSVTPSTTPGAPTSVIATSAADTQSVVSWTAPASTGGASITGYSVTSSPGGRTCAWTTGALSCTVTGLTNGTSYTFSVTATNVNGTGSASVTSSITPSTTPGAPMSVSATSAADAQSVVSWVAPVSTGGAAITGYTVTASPGGSTCSWSAGALSCTVTGLTNGTSYTFSVTATNVNGTGSASVTSSITPSTTPGAPMSVSATSAADAQSVVSWVAPVSTGGAAITGYTVGSIPGARTCAWTTGALSCTVTGLTNGTSYTFVVTATNASGISGASVTSAVTPSTTPGAPTSVIATSAADTQSVVSWTAPASTGGATITGYTVTSSPGGRTCAWTTGALSCTVTGLTNGTSYTFSVTATNVNGTGGASVSSAVTPSTTPGIPTGVSATIANAQSVVSWIAPASTGGASITGYTVTSSPGGSTCSWSAGALSCTVTGLTNGTSYTFSVAATNASGTGIASDASDSVTPTASQSITFTTVGTQLLGDKTVALTAMATSSQAVTFTSATSTVCTVSGSTVTMLIIGECTINANQSGGPLWDAALQVSNTFAILPSPPAGEPGISINNGDPYVNTQKVVLNLVWPKYASSVRISNDGGFAASKTQTKELVASIDWELDDSVKGINTKVVYLRFNGVADTTKTYIDDIVLDTTAPTIETSSAAVASSSVDVLLKVTDDLTGVNKVQIRNGIKTVTKDYASKVSIPLIDLSLSVSSSGVRKSVVTSVEIRVSDNAGNWTTWQTINVVGLSKDLITTPTVTTPTVTTPTVTTPTVTTPTVTTPTVTTPTVTTKKSATAKSIAAYAKLAVLSTSKVSLKVVSAYAKYCKVSGTTLKGLKTGSCKVTVTVTPRKGRATSKTVTLKVTK